MQIVFCNYCGRQTEYVPRKTACGSGGNMVYWCRDCGAYVGVHEGTDKPKGRLANAALRSYRQKVHFAFDPIWRFGGMTRRQAYQWLAAQMGIKEPQAHIAMLDIAGCIRAIEICNAYKRRRRHGSCC